MSVQEKVLDRVERDKARPGIVLCALLGLKRTRGKLQSMRICSGDTTSWLRQDRGTSAGDAPRRRGRYLGRS